MPIITGSPAMAVTAEGSEASMEEPLLGSVVGRGPTQAEAAGCKENIPPIAD